MNIFGQFRRLIEFVIKAPDATGHEAPEAIIPVQGPEAIIRVQRIDPMLANRGWQKVERETHIKSVIGDKRYRADYVLYLPDDTLKRPVALLEAKRDDITLNLALEQVKEYAIHMQSDIRFVFASNGQSFIQYDRFTNERTNLMPLGQFPTPSDIRALLEQSSPFRDPPITEDIIIRSALRIDPNSEHDARGVIDIILPSSEREESLRFFAETIRCANGFGAGKWNVTLPQNGNYVRLNISRLEICALFSRCCHIVLDNDALSNRRAIERYTTLIGGPPAYATVPSSIICEFDYKHLSEIKPLVWASYTSLIEKAAATVGQRTNFYKSHSPGVIDYLRHTIDSELPSPIYDIGGVE
ncbi:MAG: hypothetical protein ACYDBJ_15105 [Aggregatilineales bacterium]